MQYKKGKTAELRLLRHSQSGVGGKLATSMKSYKIIKGKNRFRSLNCASVLFELRISPFQGAMEDNTCYS